LKIYDVLFSTLKKEASLFFLDLNDFLKEKKKLKINLFVKHSIFHEKI
jgi:hypothetical protein